MSLKFKTAEGIQLAMRWYVNDLKWSWTDDCETVRKVSVNWADYLKFTGRCDNDIYRTSCLTRLYSVADFGAYGIALAIVSVLSTVANLCLDQALLVAEEQDKKSLIFEGAVFSTVIAIVSGIVISFLFNIEMGLCRGNWRTCQYADSKSV